MKPFFDTQFMEELLQQAAQSPRLRQNYDLRNSSDDQSQQMLNALQMGTVVPIHRHRSTVETVVCLCGRIEEIYYEEQVDPVDGKRSLRESARLLLAPSEGRMGLQIPAGQWHSLQVLEPAVILEVKEGAYAPLQEEDVVR